MKDKEIWQTLDIEPTKNEEDIVNVYRSLIVTVHPEDDPEGFKRLREAYEAAIAYARTEDNDNEDLSRNPDELDEFERIGYDAAIIYDDYKSRIDYDRWAEFLERDVFYDLDSSDKARESFLVFLLDRFYLPHEVWVKINKALTIDMDIKLLEEQFPESFLQFILRHVNQDDEVELSYLVSREEHNIAMSEQGFTDNPLAGEDILPLKDESNFDTEEDTYLCKLFDLKYQVDLILSDDNKSNPEIIDHILSYFSFLENQPFWHPVEYVEKMRYYYHSGDKDTAIGMARLIIFNEAIPHIFYTVGEAALILLLEYESMSESELNKVRKMVNTFAEETPNNYPLLIDCALLLYIDKDYINASEKIVDIINEVGEEPLSLKILEMINVNLIADYKEKVKNDPDNSEYAIQLARYLCQLDRWQEAIDNLLNADITGDLECDYYWFIGRSYFELENYKECIPYLNKWNEYLDVIIDETKDVNIEELPIGTQHRLNRRNYGYAILGRALTREGRFDEAENTYDKLISFSDEPGHPSWEYLVCTW